MGKDINYFHHFVHGFCKWLLPSEWIVSRCKKKMHSEKYLDLSEMYHI